MSNIAGTSIQALMVLLFVMVTAAVSIPQTDKSAPQSSTGIAAATAPASDPVLVGAGDIASCDDLAGAYATAKLGENIPGTVFAAGDLAYPNGSDQDFATCSHPTWGRFKNRPRPSRPWEPRVQQRGRLG